VNIDFNPVNFGPLSEILRDEKLDPQKIVVQLDANVATDRFASILKIFTFIKDCPRAFIE
jgi:hypothetical protein